MLYHIRDLRITLIFEDDGNSFVICAVANGDRMVINMSYNTEKRSELLGFLKENSDRAFSIEEICDRLTDGGRGKSTLYRQTAKLVEEGFVSRIPQGSRKFVYQYMDKHQCAGHLHLKCLDCGKLLHLDSATSHAVENDLLFSQGFAIDGGCILYGKCRSCNLK